MTWEDIYRHEQIERYLRGKLSAEEKKSFEEEMLINSNLAEEVELHRTAEELVFVAGLANLQKTISDASQIYQYKQAIRPKLMYGSISLIGLLSVSALLYFNKSTENQYTIIKKTLVDTIITTAPISLVEPLTPTPSQNSVAKHQPTKIAISSNIVPIEEKEYNTPIMGVPIAELPQIDIPKPIEPILVPEKPIVIPKRITAQSINQDTTISEKEEMYHLTSTRESYAFYPLLGEYWEYPVSAEGTLFQIFDKNGALVFSAISSGYTYTDRWDGKRLNGEELPMGIYQYRFIFPDKTEKIGTVTLLK